MGFIKDIQKSFRLLERSARTKLLLAALLQVLLGVLDLVGVALSGITGSLVASSLLRQSIPSFVQKLLNYLHLEGQDPATNILIVSFLALLFFLAKSLLAIYFSRRVFHFLAMQQAKVSAEAVRKLFRVEYLWIKNQNPHDIAVALNEGISAATVNNLGQSVLLASEISLILLFLTALVIVNPLVAIVTIIYFLLIGYFLNYFISSKVGYYGQRTSELLVKSRSTLSNSLNLFREVRILKRNEWFEHSLAGVQKDSAATFADNMWIQQIPKYIMEIGLLFGISGLLVISKAVGGHGSLLPILGVYIASAGRLFPALLRVQSSILSLRQNTHLTHRAFDLLEVLNSTQNPLQEQKETNRRVSSDGLLPWPHPDISKGAQQHFFINVAGLNFSYPDATDDLILSDVSFSITQGEHLVITGPSGAGKSTLCDLLLGLLDPTSGFINIEGRSGADWVSGNAGAVSYLPQDTKLIEGSILENVCLGIPSESINEERVNEVLKQSQLATFIGGLPLGLETSIGQQGMRLSGGQRQRIGIARSLYAMPNLIIMDEATSSLDAETEHSFMKLFDDLDERITVILIAHRLSSVRNAKRILYLENGKLVADGNFLEVRKQAPSFDNQAKLSGL